MSDLSFHSRLSDARSAMPLGLIGALALQSYQDRATTVVNSLGLATDVWTIAVPGSVDNSTAYSVTVDGVAASYTSDASATQAELGAGLVAAIGVEPGVRGQVTAAYSGGTLTLTGTWPGVAHTVSVSGGTGSNILGTPSNSTSPGAS